jgi:hypothetical protein
LARAWLYGNCLEYGKGVVIAMKLPTTTRCLLIKDMLVGIGRCVLLRPREGWQS